MKLSNFKKNKKAKVIMGLSFVAIAGVTALGLYRSYALYESKKEYNVIKGTVPEFNTGDIKLAFTINSKDSTEPFPNKSSGYSVKSVKCDNNVTAQWNTDYWGLVNVQNPDHVNRIKCSVDFEATLSNYIMAKSEYDSSVVKEEHEETVQTGDKATIDYRYIGANPNNYVCLEANGNCTDDQLYRIVGVMPTQKDEEGEYENRVKLVKYTSLGRFKWSGQEGLTNNDWTASKLNTETLNTTYWESISDYQNYIEKAKWYLGASTAYVGTLTSEFYKNERGNVGTTSAPKIIKTITYIGLLYPSDYGYGTSGGSVTRDVCLSRNLYAGRDGNDWSPDEYIDCVKNDWVFLGNHNYLITGQTGGNYSTMVFTSTDKGVSNDSAAPSGYSQSVYPSFYLKSSVKYSSGTGTKNDPYRVTIE